MRIVPGDTPRHGIGIARLQVISYLEAMLLADGIRNIPIGTPSTQDTAILSSAQLDLENYHGDKLADDSEQFAQDEQGVGHLRRLWPSISRSHRARPRNVSAERARRATCRSPPVADQESPEPKRVRPAQGGAA